MKIATTTVTQSANEILGVEAKNLHYLILETNDGQKYIINVGKKTHDNVQKMIDSEVQQSIQPKQPKPIKPNL